MNTRPGVAACLEEYVVYFKPGRASCCGSVFIEPDAHGRCRVTDAGTQAVGIVTQSFFQNLKILAQVIRPGIEIGFTFENMLLLSVQGFYAFLILGFRGWQLPGFMIEVEIRLCTRQIRIFPRLGLSTGDMVT